MNGHFFEVNGKFGFTIDVGYDPATGKRKQVRRQGFSTKRERQEAYVKLTSELMQIGFVETTKMTIERYLQDWLKYKKISIMESTYNSYFAISKVIIKHIGKLKMESVKSKDITALYETLLQSYSNSSIADVHKVLVMVFDHAKKESAIKKNPMEIIKKPKLSMGTVDVWSQSDCQRFLNGIVGKPLYNIFHIALSTGMRQSEILALDWSFINLDDKTIQVVQRISRDGKKIEPYVKTSASRRQIAIDDNTIRILKESDRTSNLLSATKNGTPISPRNLMRTYYSYIKLLDMPKITFHDLRHTHATLLLKAGVNPKIVAERLGHANMRITLERYSHVLPNMQKEVADKVNNFF